MVRDVLAFDRSAEPITLDRLGENDDGRSGVLDRSIVGGMHFDGVVTAEPHAGEVLVRKMLHHLEQPGIGAKKVLPKVSPALDEIFLILAVGDLAHASKKHTIAIRLNEIVPIAAPDDLDDVPSRATENRFQFLDDLAVSTHRSVETLQVAVDHENQVVKPLSRTQRNRAVR